MRKQSQHPPRSLKNLHAFQILISHLDQHQAVELFDEQTDAYKKEVLPTTVSKRMVVEAAESFGWHRFIGLDGDSVTMNRFGASAPGGKCLKEFGFTVENVVAKAKALLG